jgi:predicted peptidase
MNIFVGRTWSSSTGSLPYRIFIPSNYNSQLTYPVVFCLHGGGERGTGNKAQIDANQMATLWADPANQAAHPCFVIAPQCPGTDQWVNTPWGNGSYSIANVPVSTSMKLAMEIFSNVRANYSIDSTRIYVTGLSMGGYGAWDIIERNPNLFAAAIPIAGAGDPSQASLIKSMPIWAFATADDGIVPVSGSRDMTNALIKAGGSQKYTEYATGGHSTWGPAYSDPNLIPWLFNQHK